jgi:hypothetical protein
VEEHQWPPVDPTVFDQVEFSPVIGRDRRVGDIAEPVEGLTGRLVDALLFVSQIAAYRKGRTAASERDTRGGNRTGEEE